MSWARVGRLLRDDGPLGRALAAVLLAVAWVATWRPQVDPDAWWHLAIGESIARTGAVPASESFSWLTAGDRFVAHSWLWDVLLAGAWRIGGATGTSLLVVPVTALIVWLVWRLLGLSAPGLPPLGRAALVLLAMIVTLPMWAPRAQTLDVALVLATVFVEARYLREGWVRGLFTLPVIGLLWANLHGSAILAMPLTVAIGSVALPVGVRWAAWPPRAIVPLALAGLAGVAATVVNPYGAALLTYPFDREVASAFSPAIAEWAPPDFGAIELLPFRVLVVGLLLVAAWYPARSRDPFLWLVAAAWTFAALGSVRFLSIAGPLLVVAVAPAAGVALLRWLRIGTSDSESAGPPIVGDATPQGGQATERRSMALPAVDPRPATVIAALAIAGILTAGWLIIDPARQDAAVQRRLPVAAVAALQTSGCTARVLPEYSWAGYLVWSTGRQVGAYGNSAEAAVEGQAALEALVVDPGPWLDDHGVGAVLMPADSPLSRWLDEASGWRLLYRDTQATIHARADTTVC